MQGGASTENRAFQNPEAYTDTKAPGGQLTGHLTARELVGDVLVLVVYGGAFTLLRLTSAGWATHILFSVWFPAAGLRFAFLWFVGARWAPAAALAEAAVSISAGTVTLSSDLPLSLIGVVGPCLIYGAVIAIVQARTGQPRTAQLDPLAFGVAAVLGPMAASGAALLWALPLSLQHGSFDATLLLSSLLVFTLGDLLGILIVAPPLLWLARNVQQGAGWPRIGSKQVLGYVELGVLFGCASAVVWLLQRLGDGLVLAPVLLAGCWCGLRGGRPVAWVAILLAALVVLPMTEHGASDAAKVQVHMQLACVAIGAYLAGSYADVQRQAIAEINHRDRLLFRAERLKTLRAMSVAVIHEVSQPLSTIAIEARAMLEASQNPRPDLEELKEIASLITRKADDLAELVRRLRAFGSGGTEQRAVQNFSQLIDDVVALATPEARNAAVSIERDDGSPVTANLNDVEIRQALLNLVRNAIAAAPKPGGVVKLGWTQDEGRVRVWVDNSVGTDARSPSGMGLGLIIARTIAQAHGGRLSLERTPAGGVRSSLDLPLEEGSEL